MSTGNNHNRSEPNTTKPSNTPSKRKLFNMESLPLKAVIASALVAVTVWGYVVAVRSNNLSNDLASSKFPDPSPIEQTQPDPNGTDALPTPPPIPPDPSTADGSNSYGSTNPKSSSPYYYNPSSPNPGQSNQWAATNPQPIEVNYPNRQLTGTDLTDMINKGTIPRDVTHLDLSHNYLNNVAPLASLTHLESLDLSRNNISNIDSLSSLTNLKWLNLSSNNVTDITSLRSLTQLSVLVLDYNNIYNVEPLSSLHCLTWLDLHNNRLYDVSSLRSLTNITTLIINNNNINDITSLIQLTDLNQLYVANNGLRRSQIEYVRYYLPNCAIYY